MKKGNRILKNYEFSEIIQGRRLFKTPSFVFYFRKRRLDTSRIGISAGKKLGNAPARNLVKRQVRSMCDAVFHFNEDYDTICIVRPVYLRHSYAENLRQMEQARQHMERLKGE